MPEYAMAEGSIGSHAIYADHEQRPSPRIEQIKALDEALALLGMRVSSLTDRLLPALRGSDLRTVAIDHDKTPSANESDIVAHLRHTVSRVNGLGDDLASLLDRLDI